MDLDVSNYSVEELSSLIGIDELTRPKIDEAIEKQKKEHPSKKSAIFFEEIKQRLITEIEEPVQKVVEVDVKKGTINPDLKTTITRLINVDSAYRSQVTLTNTVDEFVFELTEPLLNVVSLSFYSLELPQSWYTISNAKGTDTFVLYLLDTTAELNDKSLLVRIKEGNYTTEDFCRAVILAIQNAIDTYNATSETTFDIQILGFDDCYDNNNGLFTFKFTSGFVSEDRYNYTIQLLWYDEKKKFTEMANNRYDYNIGWLLGIRYPLTTLTKTETDTGHLYTSIPDSLVDVGGTKYIILSLDDYKTNRLNRSIVSINNTPNTQMPLPNYYSQDLPMYRLGPKRTHVLQSNPRNLTAKQIYTINAIMDKGQNKNIIKGYDSSDSFAKISVKRTDWGKTVNGKTVILDVPNKIFVENGGPSQLQSREYFGPVDILFLSVALYDDKGNILGLNGMDWSFSIMAKCIYQY